ncbi:hypothetical protein Trydic_g6972, partial [Trypoxylus dichotomus]
MVLQNMWPAVEVNNLHSYIRECISNNDFEKQFEAVPCGQTKPWVSGTIPNNRPKNRFTNLAAYDHTRVKLETVNGNPLSDYINANYIDGYKMKKAYIATQGPKDCTVNDFWRMIWQEEVEYIVMLANIVESGKKPHCQLNFFKCDRCKCYRRISLIAKGRQVTILGLNVYATK